MTEIEKESRTHDLLIPAEYFQFYLQDSQVELDVSEDWDDQALMDMVAAAGKILGVRTMREMDVPVTVEISPSEPEEELHEYDHVVDCCLEIPSGVLIVSGPTEDVYGAQRIDVTPGIYRARVCFGALDEVDDDGFEGDDFYKIVLWPGDLRHVKVLKQWQPRQH